MCCLKTRHGGFERGAGGRLDDWRGAGYRYVRKLGIESRGCRRGRKEGHLFLDVVGCGGGSSTTICLAACGRVRVVRKRGCGGSDCEAYTTVVVKRLLDGRQWASTDVGKWFMR